MKEQLDRTIIETDYDVEQLDSLEGLEAVRTRPGMYIGSTSQNGVTHLVWEVADNSIDEAVAGYGETIKIHVAKDATVTIADQGRGIPVGLHPKWKNPDGTPQNALTGVLTRIHAGGKFNKKGSGYKVSGGLHGVGAKAVNALSDNFIATVKRDGKVYRQTFSKGVPTSDVEVVGKCTKEETGTTISYHPDPEIFKLTLEPHCRDLQNRIDELASLNSGITIEYINEITKMNKSYCYEDGIAGYVKRMATDKVLLYDTPIYVKGNYELSDTKLIMVEIAFIHDDEEKPSETIKTFANNINTPNGGFHLKGFRSEFSKQINQFGINNKLIQEPIELKYLLDGIHAVVSVKIPEAEFEGQTKSKLGNAEAQEAVEEILAEWFKKLNKNASYKTILETIIVRSQKVKEAEEAARKARANVRKANKASKLALPGKLADCASKGGYSEIFLVEGDSAAGPAKDARYRDFQAVLPLRGKVLNTEKSTYDKMIDSEAIKTVIAALGAGVGKTFDIKKVRYDKIILLTDADVDGSHIKSLILTFFYKYMTPLLEEGMVYVTIPPLYRISNTKGSIYIKDDAELKEYKKKHPGTLDLQRFKGLGEMNWEQLKETTMDPQKRILKRVGIPDAQRAKETIDICMGKRVDVRREFIEANASRINLDI